jgi:hypothetical protein
MQQKPCAQHQARRGFPPLRRQRPLRPPSLPCTQISKGKFAMPFSVLLTRASAGCGCATVNAEDGLSSTLQAPHGWDRALASGAQTSGAFCHSSSPQLQAQLSSMGSRFPGCATSSSARSGWCCRSLGRLCRRRTRSRLGDDSGGAGACRPLVALRLVAALREVGTQQPAGRSSAGQGDRQMRTRGLTGRRPSAAPQMTTALGSSAAWDSPEQPGSGSTRAYCIPLICPAVPTAVSCL